MTAVEHNVPILQKSAIMHYYLNRFSIQAYCEALFFYNI